MQDVTDTNNSSTAINPPVDTNGTTPTAAPVVADSSTATNEEIMITSTETTTGTDNATVVTQDEKVAPAATLVKKNWCTPVMKQYGIAFGIVLLIGGTLWYFLEEQGRVETKVFGTIKSMVVPAPAVMVINGQKVTEAMYQKTYEQLSRQAAAQGMDVADAAVADQVKQQSIDVLTNSSLLRQAALAAGIVVTDADIEERYQTIVEAQGGEETLNTRMTELGITKESLMSDIKDEILIQSHLDTAVDTSSITITDEEVKALYDSVASNPSVDIPPLEEVRSQIEQEIRFGKEQELISEYIETLKKDATIEVLI